MPRATFYLQRQAVRDPFSDRVTGVRAARITQARPDSTVVDSVTTKVIVDVPAEAFEPVAIAEVTIPLQDLSTVSARTVEPEPVPA